MALLSITSVADGVELGLWIIAETEQQLITEYPFINRSVLDNVKSGQRRLELLSVRALLFAMTHNPRLTIDHATSGAPMVDGYRIGISHTKGFAAIILSKTRSAVSVDIEYKSERVGKITDKFIREDEERNGLERQLLTWSAKETVYKLRPEACLGYFDMRLHHFDVADKGLITVDNLKENETLPVHYSLTENYVLTYSFV